MLHESSSLVRRVARFHALDAPEQAAILEQICELRDLAAQGPGQDLTGYVEIALSLVGALTDKGDRPLEEAAWAEGTLNVVSRLVGLVEDSIHESAAGDAATALHERASRQEQLLIRDMLLGEVLVQLGVVTQEQVDEALRAQRSTDQRIGKVLVESGVATFKEIEAGVAIQDQLRQSGGAGALFGALLPNHPLWQHEFLRRCRTQQLSEKAVKILASQMYRFCCDFSRILANTFVRCPDEYARVVMADNLFDEMGNGDQKRSHPELFRRFTRALKISDEELEQLQVEPETQSLIDTYLALPDRYGYLASLGAICYASENIVAALYTQLLSGIESSVSVPDDALVFFESHVGLDMEHANALIDLVNRGVKTFAEARKVVLAIKEAIAARIRFFDGIERCVRRASNTGSRSTDANI